MDQDSFECMTTENLMDTQFDTDICDNPSTSSTVTNPESELPCSNNILDLNLVSDSSALSVPGAHIKLVKNKTAPKTVKPRVGNKL